MSAFDAWIGRSETRGDLLTEGLLARFHATLDTSDTGVGVGPQGIHWCLCLPDAPMAELGEDGHPRRGGFLPPVDLPRRMWAASSVEFLAPLRAGTAVERTSTVAAAQEKQGGTGRLLFVEVDHEVRADGMPAVRERQTIVYREAATGAKPAASTARSTPAPAETWDWERVVTPSETLLFRYSALTFNAHRIHYDRPYATGVEDYAGLVVHGPLTATLLLELCARNLGANALRTFAFRGLAPAIAGQPLRLCGRRDGALVELRAFDADGRAIMAASATNSPGMTPSAI